MHLWSNGNPWPIFLNQVDLIQIRFRIQIQSTKFELPVINFEIVLVAMEMETLENRIIVLPSNLNLETSFHTEMKDRIDKFDMAWCTRSQVIETKEHVQLHLSLDIIWRPRPWLVNDVCVAKLMYVHWHIHCILLFVMSIY